MPRSRSLTPAAVVAGLGAILLAVVVMASLFAVPTTWILMLFLGNLGLDVSFWGALPGGLLLGTLASRVTVSKA